MIAAGVVLVSGCGTEASAPAGSPPPPEVAKAAPLPARPHVPAEPGPGRDWPQYGNDTTRARYMPGVTLRPPFRRVWSLNGGKLIYGD